METTIDSLPPNVIARIVSYMDHVTLRALRVASARFHVTSIPNTAVARVARYARRVRHTTLLNLAAAAIVNSVPLDAPLPYSQIPKDLHDIVSLHRLFWLSQQPCTPLVCSVAAQAASSLRIGRGPCQCLCEVWDMLYRVLCSL
ncbi:hypothetical protein pmac_cds_354 [Pandoravirus macleodensis]|uniref:F-box domain-containing protein n=1 Tax=Pandoravirus macleodensis TaxID=2107707 RepID=A0A2U7UF65_9VIRU|nr:hypothetical protein pmac_cds_354 [Pandoravirus macleodensis]AVK77042.1 hypothetical protein pmac_cds_354 [Pandoravirus macleodensis]UMO79724.1 hypothetical protein [Pandoravirus aubagnensis]